MGPGHNTEVMYIGKHDVEARFQNNRIRGERSTINMKQTHRTMNQDINLISNQDTAARQ